MKYRLPMFPSNSNSIQNLNSDQWRRLKYGGFDDVRQRANPTPTSGSASR